MLIGVPIAHQSSSQPHLHIPIVSAKLNENSEWRVGGGLLNEYRVHKSQSPLLVRAGFGFYGFSDFYCF
jgi:hypothetical protein